MKTRLERELNHRIFMRCKECGEEIHMITQKLGDDFTGYCEKEVEVGHEPGCKNREDGL